MKNLDIIFNLLSYEGSPTNDPSDGNKIKNKISETAITSVTREQFQIADATVDEGITFPDDNPDYVVILCDQDISIKLNGWVTALTLKTKSPGKKTLMFFTKGPVSALTVSNSSGQVANIDVILANK